MSFPQRRSEGCLWLYTDGFWICGKSFPQRRSEGFVWLYTDGFWICGMSFPQRRSEVSCNLEYFVALITYRRSADHMHRSTGIVVRISRITTVVDRAIVHRPQSFVAVLVRPDAEVHSVLIEEVFQGQPAAGPVARPYHAFVECAVVLIVITVRNRWIFNSFFRQNSTSSSVIKFTPT